MPRFCRAVLLLLRMYQTPTPTPNPDYLPQLKEALTQMYAHVSQLGAGPVAAGGGDTEDGEKDDDTSYVSDSFALMSFK